MLRTTLRVLPAVLAAGATGAAATAALASDGTAAAGTVPTRVATVRPVTATGGPAPGWAVHRESGTTDCRGGSSSAVDGGITFCMPTATYLPSCWRSSDHTVLCVRDTTSHRLVRMRYSGSFPTAKPHRRPMPQDLVLGSGVHCSVRVGGAWGPAPGHPSWVGYYSCSTGDLYGPTGGDGIDRSHPAWPVHLVTKDGHVVTRTVRQANVVGTAS